MADWLTNIDVLGVLRNLLSFVVVFGILVFIHELGHFLVAKWSGVRVHEFALGFGPALISKQIGETLYAIRIIPLGGFVKLAGMEPTETLPDDEAEAMLEDDERAFHRRPAGHRMAILAAGPIMNLLLAAVIYAVILSGLVVTVGPIVPGSPADEAGLQPGDRFVSVAGKRVLTVQQVLEGIQQPSQDPVRIVVDRQGHRETLFVQPRPDPATGIPVIGIELRMDTGTARRPLGESIVAGLQQTRMATTELIRTLGLMITGRVEAELAGPIGIYQMTGTFAEGGLLSLMTFMAMLSVSLGVFNLLPIPILDGGGLLFTLVEAIRGRPLDPEHKGIAQLVGLSLLVLLLLYATWQDIGRFGSGEQSQTSINLQHEANDLRLSSLELLKDGGSR